MAEKKYLNEVGLAEVATHVNTRLKTVTTIPVSADDGAVRLYVGTTNDNYTKGHVYQYDLANTTWKDITNFSIIFTGTTAEWNALSLVEKQAYDICNITDDVSENNYYTESEVDALLNEKLSYADNGILGAKNLLSYPFEETTKTVSSITFTDMGDGTIKIDGNKTDGTVSVFRYSTRTNGSFTLPAGKYKLSKNITTQGISLTIAYTSGGSGVIVATLNDSDLETEFTVTEQMGLLGVQINVVDGNYSNILLKTMLRLASDIDDTYQPYAMTNKELTELNRELTKLKTYVTPNIGARFYKIGRTCYVSFESAVTDKAYVDEDIMDTIPEEFRPIYSASLIDTLSTSHNRIIIYENIRAKGSFAAGQNIRGCLTYITNN